MLPPITAVDAIELVRDGGSLAATFVGQNSSRYVLHMQLISDRGPSGELIRRGYERPVVCERLELRDQGSFGWEAINEIELSWPHTCLLLRQMRPHVRNEDQARWLAMMLECAEGEGKRPDTLDEVLEPVGSVGAMGSGG